MNTSAGSSTAPAGRVHQEILYPDQLWRMQRFFVALLLLFGIGITVLLIVRGQLGRLGGDLTLAFQKGQLSALSVDAGFLYIPLGLLVGGFFLYYKRRSFVEPVEDGLKVSTLRHSVVIAYDNIRAVRVQPLKMGFLDARSRMIAPMMRTLMDKPALFVRIKVDEDQSALILKRLGRRMMYEDTIALPIRDADAVAWAINSRLPERIGQNQGGARRRKRRR